MEKNWRAVASGDISEPALKEIFSREELSWADTLHVTATSSLAREMRAHGARALSIQDLIDLVVWTADDDLADAYLSYPTFAGQPADVHRVARSDWASRVTRRRLELGIEAEMAIRSHLHHVAGGPELDVLRRSAADLRRGFLSLASSGVEPRQIQSTDALISAAVEAWVAMEAKVPQLVQVRADLWVDSGPAVSSLHERLAAVLSHLLMGEPEHIQVAYHGFYFFTAPQWAWFQRLRARDQVAQIFLVHDDGIGRRFETWRRFFVSSLAMPRVERAFVRSPVDQTRGPALLDAALSGRTVPSTIDNLRVVSYRSPAQFSAAWRRLKEEATSARLFAAGTEDVQRMMRRFDSDSPGELVSLAELPPGQFLIALHDCLEEDGGGRVSVRLSADRLLDMAASGALDGPGGASAPSLHIAAIGRSMPYFDGLREIGDWKERAEKLASAVADVHHGFPVRGAAGHDIDRVDQAARNPLRLAPWLDLTVEESTVVGLAIERAADLADGLVKSLSIATYLDEVKARLRPQLRTLPPEVAAEIEQKLRPLFEVDRKGSMAVDVTAVKSAVEIVLGRKAEVGPDSDADTYALRNLDALAFAPSAGPVHVANLSDRAFPSQPEATPWPFDWGCIEGAPSVRSEIKEILALRHETSALSDLYLFGLALGSVRPGAELTLSWMTEFRADSLNPSPLLSLILNSEVRADVADLRLAIGGLSIEHGDFDDGEVAVQPQPPVKRWGRNDAAITQAVSRLNPASTAAAFACARRFVLQWALGDSPSFGSTHHHSMLYGNLEAALQRMPRRLSAARAHAIVLAGWQQLTEAQRESSLGKSAVKPLAVRRSARWQWIYTLAGQEVGGGALGDAYRAAFRGRRPSAAQAVPDDGFAIPPSTPPLEVCEACPVRSRCTVAVFRERR